MPPAVKARGMDGAVRIAGSPVRSLAYTIAWAIIGPFPQNFRKISLTGREANNHQHSVGKMRPPMAV
jgi:hypothetical protein